MFQADTRYRTTTQSALGILEVIFFATARSVRKSHPNAIVGLAINMIQTMTLVFVFYIMFTFLGLRGVAVRGDFMVYIMSGIFLFMTQNKAMGAVLSSEGPASPMMQHAPMSTFVSIISNALGTLYIQILSVLLVLFVYNALTGSVAIDNPVGAFSMLLLAWFVGVSVGLCFLALKPWFPQFVSIASTIYMRANMLASGKMFLANTLPFYILKMFDWNPLFHVIDQSRGFAFINYNPHYSNTTYPLILACVLLVIGFMGESYTRKHASMSWGARR
ncbi:ABC transporter permease [Aliiroseovarius sp.]|uniref:ABC transporter permease n=1 Tax=Aliiroseovarius sp. TaxID=1872442 RepID=UPI002635CFF0|nr:ABC transporter permease [Aliiroseovarius sp.]